MENYYFSVYVFWIFVYEIWRRLCKLFILHGFLFVGYYKTLFFCEFSGMSIETLRHYIEVLRILGDSNCLSILSYLYKLDGSMINNVIKEVKIKRSTFYNILHKLKRYGFIEHKRGYISLTKSGRRLLEWITYGLNNYYGFKNYGNVVISKDELKRLYVAASRGYYWLYLRGIVTSYEYRDFITFLQKVKRLIK